MPRLPAFCEACGAVYPSPLRAAAPGDENAFDIPVPCPVCGESGRVPAELLEICLEAARAFASSGEDAGAFLELLEDPPDADEADEELLSRTASRAPDLVGLARRLPAGRPRILEGIGRLLRRVADRVAGDDPRAAASSVPDVVEAFLEEEGAVASPPDPPPAVARARRRLDEAGRNDPCPCGSGDKYKDCHWTSDLRTTRS